MCCMRLAENTGRKKSPKIRHLRPIAQLCWAVSLQLRHVSTIGKQLVKQQYLLQMSSQYSELRPNGSDRFGCLRNPQQTSTGSASCLRYCRDVAHRGPTKLCTMFGHLLGWYTIIIHFEGSCSLREFCHLQSSLCVQVVRSPILATLLQCTWVVGVSKTLRRWTEGATYMRQGGHHVGHWPHSSFVLWFLLLSFIFLFLA